MSMIDNEIMGFDIAKILSVDTIYDFLEIQNDLTKTRIKALLFARAKQLKIEKEFKNVMKAYTEAETAIVQDEIKKESIRDAKLPLKFGGDGKPTVCIDNFLTILNGDKRFESLRFNTLAYTPEVGCGDGKSRRYTDADDAETRHYIESEYSLHSPKKLDDALRICFRTREYNPVHTAIESVKWDGVPRVENFLSTWLKVDDDTYGREVSRLIFAGGINRIYNPGCKFDDVIVLIGTEQGEGKSTIVRWLALEDEFFNEVTEIDGQKGMEATEGAWICEVAELLALTRTKDVEGVKSYISRQSDRYRRPFDKRVTDHKRQCVFIGTTNKEQFLTDKTGNRRFYPIRVHQKGFELYKHEKECKADILQCWAEAKYKMDMGEMPAVAKQDLQAVVRSAQDNATEEDYRKGQIEEFLRSRDETCVIDVWEHALKGEYTKPTKKDSNEIALILNSLEGWKRAEKNKRILGYGVQMYWSRIETPIL
ncbi:MAG: virulence-associated E family protein [Oscillospiraceae bacterium]